MSFQTRKLTREKPPRRPFRWPPLLLRTLAVLPLVAQAFWRHWKLHEEKRKGEQRLIRILRYSVVTLSIVGLVAAIGLGAASALMAMKIISVRQIAGVVGSELPQDRNGFTNILLLGQGDESHQGADLTDTIIVASLDPKRTKSIAMLSLPRDLYLTGENDLPVGRINTAYRSLKGKFRAEDMSEAEASHKAMQELATHLGGLLGIEIHRVVKVDFTGFEDVVDALGGVDIDVPEAIYDTAYPTENYGYQIFSLSAGPQHLDGATALKYARSRHSTSDFSRSARQQQLVMAIAQRAKEKGILKSPGTITALYNAMQKNMETTMDLRELIGGARLGTDLDRGRIVSFQLNDRNGLAGSFTEPGGFLYTPPRENFDGAFVLLPISGRGQDAWEQIRVFVQLVLTQRELYLANPQVDVLNAGAANGLARTLGSELLRNGFGLNELRNAEIPDLPSSHIVALTQTGSTYAPFFESLLQIPLQQELPPELDLTSLGDITILLGQDYEYRSIPQVLTEDASSPSS